MHASCLASDTDMPTYVYLLAAVSCDNNMRKKKDISGNQRNATTKITRKQHIRPCTIIPGALWFGTKGSIEYVAVSTVLPRAE